MSMEPSPGARLRERLAAGTLVLPGAFNAITARLAESVGFEAVYISGAGVTNALTAFPDDDSDDKPRLAAYLATLLPYSAKELLTRGFCELVPTADKRRRSGGSFVARRAR